MGERRRARPRRLRRRGGLGPVVQALPAVVAFGLAALGWQLVAHHTSGVIPGLGRVWQELSASPRLYLDAAAVTLREALVGLAFGLAAAFVLAVGMTELPVVRRALMPLAVVVNVTPIVAVAPALTIAFGFGYAPKYLLTGIVVFFPFLINAAVGLTSVDGALLEVFESLHASRADVLWRLRLPTSVPYLFAAARVCFPLALVGAVVAEFGSSGTTTGLGNLVITDSQQVNLAAEYAAVLCLAAIGVGLMLVVVLLQRTLWRWAAPPRRR